MAVIPRFDRPPLPGTDAMRRLLLPGRPGAHGVPLGNDPSSRFLGWITGLMCYLATLALAGTLAVSAMAARWDSGLAGGLSVQVAAEPPGDGATVPLSQRVESVLTVLRATPGVREARPLSPEEMSRLLAPWLGPDVVGADSSADLPIPALIDVAVSGPVDVAELTRRLEATAAGVAVDDHGAWLDDLSDFATTVRVVAGTVLALVGTAGVAAVAFAVWAGLAIHHRVVRLLHLMGATDAFIARQFQAHALTRVLRGGSIGTACAIVTLIALDATTGDVKARLLPSLTFTTTEWLALALPPLVMAALAGLTARWTVKRALESMP